MFGKSLTSSLRNRRGASAVEFALISPVLILLLAGGVDFGTAMYTRMQLSSAVRAGIQYAMHHSADPEIIRQTVYGALTVTTDDITVDVSQTCECSNGAGIDCANTCSVGRRSTFIHISVNGPYEGMFSLPMTPTELHAEATVRVD